MIYIKSFSNYDEFKELFGMNEHGNGVKSRKNKILLSMLKNKALIHEAASAKGCWYRPFRYGYNHKGRSVEYRRWAYCSESPLAAFMSCQTMDELRRCCYSVMQGNGRYSISLNNLSFHSDIYATDDLHGLCEDGDTTCVRYRNVERDRIFKMKAGKFVRKLIESSPLDNIITEQVKIWLCEDFASEWQAFANSQLKSEYELHVDDNFEDIYDSECCKGCFHSCMVDHGYHTFYEDAVDAKAAYLTDADGCIVARCIIYTKVHDEDGNILRLAERQYSSDCDDSLKRQLVLALINAGEIDGYKRVGADCGAASAFVDIHGNPFPSSRFWIPCKLEPGDTVSYQDSFKWWNHEEQCAYNWATCDYDDTLTYTSGELEWDNHEHDCWSRWNDEWIDEDSAYYVDTRDDWFYSSQVRDAYVLNRYTGKYYEQTCFEDDCIQVGNGDWYYAGDNGEYPESYGIHVCPYCGEYFVESEGYESDLTSETYCCSYCRDEAENDYKDDNWYYSEYDDEYFEYSAEVVKAMLWDDRLERYVPTTISVDTFNALVDDYEATSYGDVLNIDSVGYDGEPVHICHQSVAA